MISIKFPEETQIITSLETTNPVVVDVTACNKTLIDEVKATYGDVPNVEIIAPEEKPQIPNNQIWYTASSKVTPYSTYELPTITSHEFSDGKGTITFATDVTSIDNYTFYNCSGLTSITIPDSVTSIGGSAFQNCKSLTSINIPDSVTTIYESAFNGCSGLTSITIPDSVTSIGGSAFQDCNGITSINVSEGNTKYDSRNNCNAIIETATNTLVSGCKNTIIPDSVTSIGDYSFWGCSGLTSIQLSSNLTSIGECAFWDCSGLTSITIPDSVTSIGYSVFRNCSKLTTITIPSSVTRINESAFNGCSGLTSITFKGTTVQWNAITKGSNWKYNVPTTCQVVCTDGTISI